MEEIIGAVWKIHVQMCFSSVQIFLFRLFRCPVSLSWVLVLFLPFNLLNIVSPVLHSLFTFTESDGERFYSIILSLIQINLPYYIILR
jgi:hypothetical protein